MKMKGNLKAKKTYKKTTLKKKTPIFLKKQTAPESQFLRKDLKIKAPTGGSFIEYEDLKEKPVVAGILKGNDFDAVRLKRLMAMPDLARKENSPVKFILDEILKIKDFKGFDVVKIPETVTVKNAFDLFNFPQEHPGRRPTDTYFLDSERILRTHTTSMWLYYLSDKEVLERLNKNGWVGELCYGKVYRKDEIDRKHFPVFHQIDGMFVSKKSEKIVTLKMLQDVLANIMKSVFGNSIEYRFLDDAFPFTNPSTQIEIKWGNDWLEVVGAGIVHNNVLRNFGLDPEIYNGWAFGFGLERLAIMKMKIPDIRVLWSEDERITKQFKNINSVYEEVSKYPEIIRDISFIVDKSTSLNGFYEIVRHCAGDLAEEVKLIDQFENAKKFGENKKSYTFRVVYRSHERTLTNEEINVIHKQVEEMTVKDLKAVIR